MTLGAMEDLREALARRIAQAAPEVRVIRDPLWVRRDPGDKQPVVSVLIDRVQTRRMGLGDFLGTRDGTPEAGEEFGREVTLGLRLDLYHRQSGQDCYGLFARICQALMLEGFSPAPDSLSCGDAAYDRAAGAFRLVCRGEVRGRMGVTRPGAPLDRFEIRRVSE